MMGLHFMDEVPFHDVYIHALVRDEKGAKMSKSKGNVIDPLGLIDEYGADALRFTLAAMAAQGRDIKLSTQRVEGYRNFATKLWNAARFAEINGCARVEGFDPATRPQTLNRWISAKLPRPSPRSRRRSKPIASTMRPMPPIASSGIFSATGISNSRSRCCKAGTAADKAETRGDDRFRARRDRQAAASLHAIHHRGIVGPKARRPRAESLLALAPWPRSKASATRRPRPRSASSSSWSRKSARCAPR